MNIYICKQRELKLQTILELSAVPKPPLCLSENVSEYDPEEMRSYSDLGAQESCSGWWVLPDGRISMPELPSCFTLPPAIVTKEDLRLFSLHLWLPGH